MRALAFGAPRERARQVEQRIEPVHLVAVQEGLAGPEGLAARQQPGVQDAVGHAVVLDEALDKFFVGGAAGLRRQRPRMGVDAGECIATQYLDDLVALLTQCA